MHSAKFVPNLNKLLSLDSQHHGSRAMNSSNDSIICMISIARKLCMIDWNVGIKDCKSKEWIIKIMNIFCSNNQQHLLQWFLLNGLFNHHSNIKHLLRFINIPSKAKVLVFKYLNNNDFYVILAIQEISNKFIKHHPLPILHSILLKGICRNHNVITPSMYQQILENTPNEKQLNIKDSINNKKKKNDKQQKNELLIFLQIPTDLKIHSFQFLAERFIFIGCSESKYLHRCKKSHLF
eukprot:542541_1